MKKIKIKPQKLFNVAITYLIILAVCFIFLFPILWLVLASFSKTGSIYSFDGFFPKEFSFDSFVRLFTDTDLYNYPRWFFKYAVYFAYEQPYRHDAHHTYGICHVAFPLQVA